jgi:hypothetical protein
MSRILWLGGWLLLAFSVQVLCQEAGSGGEVKVEKIVAATSVESREPAGEGTEFEAAAGKVYCWTKITTKTPPSTVKHVWYLGDQKVHEFSLELKYPATRTWSVKSIRAGSWKVEVIDPEGKVLSQVAFTVK